MHWKFTRGFFQTLARDAHLSMNVVFHSVRMKALAYIFFYRVQEKLSNGLERSENKKLMDLKEGFAFLIPLSSEHGTHKTVKARLGPFIWQKSFNPFSCFLLTRQQTRIATKPFIHI